MERPSHKELTGKLGQAKTAVSQGSIEIVEPVSVAADALELGYLIEGIADVLIEIVEEIAPRNYAGTRPPQRSYEERIRGSELLAFRWGSKRFGCELYLKFALKDDTMWLVSLHPHREKEDE